MKELSPEAKSLLDAARELDDPTPEDRERVRRALMVALGAGVLGTGAVASGAAASVAPSAAAVSSAAGAVGSGSAGLAAGAVGSGSAGLAAGVVGSGSAGLAAATGAGVVGAGVSGATKVLLVLALVGTTGGGVWVATRGETPAHEANAVTLAEGSSERREASRSARARSTTPLAEVPRAAPLAEADEPNPTITDAPGEQREAASPGANTIAEQREAARPRTNAIAERSAARDAPRREPRATPSTSTPTVEASAETLAAELALLRRARARHAASDPDGALALLDEHARTFPSGTLAAERDGTRAIIRCESGRAGADEARRFAAAHPRSPLVPRVRSACDTSTLGEP